MNTLFTGQTIIRLTETGSTNNFASELLFDTPLHEGTVIIADAQSSGKGQRGSTWLSEPGKNLTFSLILKPEFLAVDKQFQLSMAIALAVKDCVISLGVDNIKIKWPNDIYSANSKIAGILIENLLKNDKKMLSIAGIGLNVNQEKFDPSISNPTSVKIMTGTETDLQKGFELICQCIEKRYLQLRRGEDLYAEYIHSLFRYNEFFNYSANGTIFSGRISGVSSTGKLIIETKENAVKEFDLKEIKFQL